MILLGKNSAWFLLRVVYFSYLLTIKAQFYFIFIICWRAMSVCTVHNVRCNGKQGPKLTFLGRRQLATEIFLSVAIWKNVVGKKHQQSFFLRSETQTKIFGCHGLAGKTFAIDVIRNQTSAEIIF